MYDLWEKYKSRNATTKTKEYFAYFAKIADDHVGIPYFDGHRDELLHLAKRHTKIHRIEPAPDRDGTSLAISDNGISLPDTVVEFPAAKRAGSN